MSEARQNCKASTVLRQALAYLDSGLALLPIARDGSKRPDGRLLPRELREDGKYHATWDPFTERLPTREEVQNWFRGQEPPGIAVISGEVSGALECLDFDIYAEAIFPEWSELVEAEFPGLVGRLSIVRTPKPGFHVRYRCPDVEVPGNCKLAEEPFIDPDTGKPAKRTLVETRGEGGYALAPGCPAECHETGRLYEHYSGPTLENVQAIGVEERETLIRCARSFDRSEPEEEPKPAGKRMRMKLSPGDDFITRGPDWPDLLNPHGWVVVYEKGKVAYWKRPGKDGKGWSATTGFCVSKAGLPLFAVFSSNAHPFPGPSGTRNCSTHNKFSVYGLLNHDGDFSAAAKELVRQGYGDQSEEQSGTAASGSGSSRWPSPLAPEAYYGLAGEMVKLIEPTTEADPVALLIQILVAFGSSIGRTAHFVAEDDQHYLNEFVNLIGRTSKGRKGSSWGRVRRQYEAVDPEWASERIQTGLSSGEGLIWAVRDPIITRQPVKVKGRVTGYQEVETDPGISDKRLLVYESEFASVLKHIERQGNTLSPVIRQAWETGNLRTMTKNNPAKATNAHVNIVGHCTAEELKRYLTCTEAASGFGNRFIWMLVKRSKALPEGGRLDDRLMTDVRDRLEKALKFARTVGEMRRDDRARAVWREVYESLSEGKSGLAGALLGRAESHVMRLSCIHALMDQSRVVQEPHLLAALALWDYAEESVHCIFGKSLGDPLGDEILRKLRSSKAGLTRNELCNAFGRHKTSDEIGQALALLEDRGLARCEQQSTGGRAAERWFAVEG